jgi:C4-dicarboxylate-specific signal transduction histidine kinase
VEGHRFTGTALVAEAMELALGRADVTDALPLLRELDAGHLSDIRTQDLLRRILGSAKITELNCRAARMLAIDVRRLPLPFSEVWPFADAGLLLQSLAVAQTSAVRAHAEVALKTADGPVHVRFTTWREPGAVGGALSFGMTDISGQVTAEKDLVALRAQMAHADRLSTLGIMTATITHEVRQPVAAMMTAAQAALRWLARSSPDLDQVKQCLETVVAGATKVEETVARLRQMASNRAGARNLCAISTLIEETAEFLRPEFANRGATLTLDLACDLPPVSADCVQIRQVLTNLMINAAQAMADAQCWNRALKVRARHYDGLVVVEVDDSGPGIPEADRRRLFDGFYTTKSTGLGLGLKICRQIIEDHGGTLELVSKAGAGSVFRFTLPAI